MLFVLLLCFFGVAYSQPQWPGFADNFATKVSETTLDVAQIRQTRLEAALGIALSGAIDSSITDSYVDVLRRLISFRLADPEVNDKNWKDAVGQLFQLPGASTDPAYITDANAWNYCNGAFLDFNADRSGATMASVAQQHYTEMKKDHTKACKKDIRKAKDVKTNEADLDSALDDLFDVVDDHEVLRGIAHTNNHRILIHWLSRATECGEKQYQAQRGANAATDLEEKFYEKGCLRWIVYKAATGSTMSVRTKDSDKTVFTPKDKFAQNLKDMGFNFEHLGRQHDNVWRFTSKNELDNGDDILKQKGWLSPVWPNFVGFSDGDENNAAKIGGSVCRRARPQSVCGGDSMEAAGKFVKIDDATSKSICAVEPPKRDTFILGRADNKKFISFRQLTNQAKTFKMRISATQQGMMGMAPQRDSELTFQEQDRNAKLDSAMSAWAAIYEKDQDPVHRNPKMKKVSASLFEEIKEQYRNKGYQLFSASWTKAGSNHKKDGFTDIRGEWGVGGENFVLNGQASPSDPNKKLDEFTSPDAFEFMKARAKQLLTTAAGPSGSTDEYLQVFDYAGVSDATNKWHLYNGIFGACANMLVYYHHSYLEIMNGAGASYNGKNVVGRAFDYDPANPHDWYLNVASLKPATLANFQWDAKSFKPVIGKPKAGTAKRPAFDIKARDKVYSTLSAWKEVKDKKGASVGDHLFNSDFPHYTSSSTLFGMKGPHDWVAASEPAFVDQTAVCNGKLGATWKLLLCSTAAASAAPGPKAPIKPAKKWATVDASSTAASTPAPAAAALPKVPSLSAQAMQGALNLKKRGLIGRQAQAVLDIDLKMEQLHHDMEKLLR